MIEVWVMCMWIKWTDRRGEEGGYDVQLKLII